MILNRFAVAVGLTCGLLPGVVVGGEPITAMLDPYFRIQTQLAEDRMDTVRADATAIVKAAALLGEPGAPIAGAAKELAATSEISVARDAFGKLSTAVIGYAEATKASVGSDVSSAYCPMVNKSWLQKGDKVKNPYYGKTMQACGELKKKAS